MRIVVIEDDARIASFVARGLSSQGHQVMTAANGADGIELASETPAGWPKLVSFPRMEQLGAALGHELHPQLILLDPASPDGYTRDWRPAGLGPERHLAYAAQWFALAATAVVIWIVLALRVESHS